LRLAQGKRQKAKGKGQKFNSEKVSSTSLLPFAFCTLSFAFAPAFPFSL
jgi:hypothetical protein